MHLTNADYLTTASEDQANWILEDPTQFDLIHKIDLAVFYKGQLIICNEVKTYCDITMFKRTAFEWHDVKSIAPTVEFVLFQIENSLGGDYNSTKDSYLGSTNVHAVLSRFNLRAEIVTLSPLNRNSKYELQNSRIENITVPKLNSAINQFVRLLNKQVKRKHGTLYNC